MTTRSDVTLTHSEQLSAQFASLADEVAALARNPASVEIGALARLIDRLHGEIDLVRTATGGNCSEDMTALFDRSLIFQPLAAEQMKSLAGCL